MLKALWTILAWLLLLVYLIVVFSFTFQKEKQLVCNNLEVSIIDSAKNSFIDEQEMSKYIRNRYRNITGNSVSSIDKEVLETIIKQNPSVKNAEVYNTLTGKLHVIIKQKNPIVRILKGQNSGYYVDEEGKVMPLSKKFTSRVLIASGHINEELATGELFELSQFIYNDKFWRSQINHIHVTKEKEYILIPRVGNQKIELGSLENYQYKFRKLFALYLDGFSRTGWNKYEKINLKYKGQVVCTKKQ